MTRKALGRGLGALIPGAPEPGTEHSPQAAAAALTVDGAPDAASATPELEAAPLGDRVTDVALDRIHPNPSQPRTEFDEAMLFELAESIRAQGVLQPVLVRP